MPKLKTILQSKYLYITIIFFLILYVVILTKIIKYDIKIKNFDYLEGIVIDIDNKNDKISFIITANTNSKEKVLCNYYNKDYNDLLGKKVRVYGEKGNLYNNTIPNTFNYKKYLYNNKIYVTYNVNKIEIINKENIFYKIKNNFIKHIKTYDEKIKTYLAIFIMGDKNYLSDDLYNIYKVNGIWHLFAISGMHINLIILSLNKLLKKLKSKNIIISLILIYFAFLTGFSASVLRTILFYIIKNLNNYFNLNINNTQILIITIFIILLFKPFMIYNICFIYSFVITFALIINSKNIKGNYLIQILKISCISFLVSLPITINNNYEINIFSIFLNGIYVPFISFIFFPIIILTFMFSKLSFILNILIRILELSNQLFYKFKFVVIIPKISIFLILLYYLILIIIYKYKLKKRYYLLIIIILLLNKFVNKLDSNYYVIYFDVSQGDSSVIISPYRNKVIMIDTGGLYNSDYHISSNIILFLKSIGCHKINTLIISHGDYDHMGESFYLVNNYQVDNVIFNNNTYNNLELELINKLKQKNIVYTKNISKLNINNNIIYFLNKNIYENENDSSNIVYFKIRDYKFLFMGDAGINVEQDLIMKYNLNNITVLKVGHHGSKTSSSKNFITAIKPIYSIISVGRNNLYGHPNEEVLDNLKESHIYRTDINGSAIFKIRKNKLEIKTFPV